MQNPFKEVVLSEMLSKWRKDAFEDPANHCLSFSFLNLNKPGKKVCKILDKPYVMTSEFDECFTGWLYGVLIDN